MTTQIKRRRGTTTEHNSFTGAEGEITIDTTKDTAVVHDGSTVGGHPLAKEDGSTLTNVDIDSGAIDNTVIGGTTTAAGSFTTLQADTSLNVDGTVTADGLTVDTDTLHVDSANNRVGVLTSSPEYEFSILGGSRGVNFETGLSSLPADGNGPLIFTTQGDGSGFFDNFGGLGISARTADTSSSTISLFTSLKERLNIANNGDISFYEDTGATAKFFWDASAESLGIGGASPAGTAFAVTNAGAEGLEIRPTGGLSGGTSITAYNRSGSAYIPQTYNASEHIFVNSGSSNEKMRIDSSGNVGIGRTPEANSKLHVREGASSADKYTLHLETYIPQVVFHDISASATDFAIQVNGNAMAFRYGDASTGTNLASEAMRIDSSGNVGIGTTDPQTALHVRVAPDANWGTITAFDPTSMAADVGAMIALGGYGVGTSGQTLFAQIKGGKENGTSANEKGYLALSTNNGSVYVEGMRIDSNQNLDMTNGGGNIIMASGAGIDFSATANSFGTMSNELFDDYEEGTWEPALTATGYTFTYNAQFGLYTKVGNLVTVKCYLQATTATGSGTVAFYVTGLPFTSSSNNANFGGGSFFPDTGSEFFSRTGAVRTEPNSTQMRIANGFGGSTKEQVFNLATMPSNTEFELTAQYFV